MPIRLRVTLAFAGVMAILLAALGLFVFLRFESQLDDTIDTGLRSRGDDVSRLVAQSDTGLRESSGRVLDEEEGFAQILTPSGRVFDSTPQLSGKPLLSRSELRRAERHPIFVEREQVSGVEGPVRLLARPVDAQGRRLIVVVGASLDDRGDALNSLEKLLLIGGPAALLLASLAGFGMSVAALRPVEAMRRRAAAISAAEPGQRLPMPGARDELARLAETLNQMLERLEAALERERTFVDDASHELRTPLALHKTELELALRYGRDPDEIRAALTSSIEEVDRLIQLAEDLLVVARSEKGQLALAPEPIHLGQLLDDVRERFGIRAAEAQRSLVVDAPNGLQVEGDRLRLEQALTNLVDNALRYGGGDVLISVSESEGGIELHVRDEGPGFPPEFVDQAFERFTRADSARTRGGTGLGLAIVDAIARAHGGRARAANRPEGGADVWIDLPDGNQ